MSKNPPKSAGQADAEAEVEGFQESLGPFVVAAETSRMAMAFTDATAPGNPIIFANDSFLLLTGYGRDEVLAQPLDFLLANTADHDTHARLAAEFEESLEGNIEICCSRKDGSAFWAAFFISPVRDRQGEIVQHFLSFADITAHMQEEAASRMLIDELNHRVKNTLSTVQSIVYQALRSSEDPMVMRESIESRLFALSRSHDLLSRENWQSAGLLDVVNEALAPFEGSKGRAEHFLISGRNYRFTPKVVLALSIVFNELATNAVKYGALSNDIGSVSISWKLAPAPDGDRLVMRWQESGGPLVSPPSQKGFGSRVIEHGLAHELDGRVLLEYRPDGVLCTIDIPIEQGLGNG